MDRQRVLYFDLDGVCGDFDGHYAHLTGKTWEHRQDETHDQKWALLEPHPTFFLDLPWVPGAKEMLSFVVHSSHPYAIGVLSAAHAEMPSSFMQKRDWIDREMPWLAKTHIEIIAKAANKFKFAGDGNVLVDDSERNIDQWREAGGFGIHFRDAAQALTELQSLIQGSDWRFKRALANISKDLTAAK